MTVFTAPNKVEYKVEADGGTSLIKFVPKEGGATPKELQGSFTAEKFLHEAWGRYLVSLEKKPDMRLKENLDKGK